MMHLFRLPAVLILFTIPATASAERIAFTSETEFKLALTAFGYEAVEEGFEDDAVWGDVRTTIPGGEHTAPSVSNLGVVWTANNDNGEVTTGEGPARTGQWGFFTLPHGDFANGINDGWVGTSDELIYAIGGWVETNTPYAGIVLIIDDDRQNPVDFDGDNVLDTQHRFFGVIDTAGFQQFEFLETEADDEFKYIFGDDFTIARESTTGCPLVAMVQRLGIALPLDVFRRFRDQRLAATVDGRRLTALYEEHGRRLTRLILKNPQLARRSAAMLLAAAPAVQRCEHGSVVLDVQTFKRALGLLEAIRASADVELAEGLQEVERLVLRRTTIDGQTATINLQASGRRDD